MANANMTPMPFVRKFGSAAASSDGGPSRGSDTGGNPQINALLNSAFSSKYDGNAFVDIAGRAIAAPTVTGACPLCGFPGHLKYQCRNFLPDIRVHEGDSSTSSESSAEETPLVELEKQRKKEKKLKKKEKKEKKKKRKEEKKEKKKKRKENKKRRRRDDDSDDSDDESDSEEERRKQKKTKKEKRKRRRSTSSESSDSDDNDRRRSHSGDKTKRRRAD